MKKHLHVEYIKYRKARNRKGKRDKYAAQSKGKATGNGTGHSGTDGTGKPSAAEDRPQHRFLLHQQTVRTAVQRKRRSSGSRTGSLVPYAVVGYLNEIRSERRLEEEINYNFAYKWFCGLGLTEKAPDATTISVNRTRRFRNNNIAEQIFQEILRQAVEKKLVGGEILYTDSTHVKAKANKHKKSTVTIEKSPKAYMDELDAAITADREALSKKPFDKKDDEPPTTQIQQSKNDPESGQLHKEGKPDGFHYSEHRTVDSKNNIVVNVRITPANVNDVDPVPDILDDIEKRLGHLQTYMGVDAGSHNAPTCHQIASWGIQPVVGYRRHTHKGELFGKYRFEYQKDRNVYLCPQNKN